MKNLEQILHDKQAAHEEALQAFDQLESVPLDFMSGRWRGFEIATGHPLDGLLTQFGWYGKLFIDAEQVHPLLFYTRDRRGLFAITPKYLPLGPGLRVVKGFSGLAPLGLKLFQTRRPAACLRMKAFRGKETATMVYNDKPICDSFRKIDDDRVLGVMDFKGVPQPYFFVLVRDDGPPYAMSVEMGQGDE